MPDGRLFELYFDAAVVVFLQAQDPAAVWQVSLECSRLIESP
jgi:hypothetical protein